MSNGIWQILKLDFIFRRLKKELWTSIHYLVLDDDCCISRNTGKNEIKLGYIKYFVFLVF